MYHKLKFTSNYTADLHRPGFARLEQVILKAGEVIEAQVRSYVQELDGELFECSDLFLPGGETLLEVRMASFSFL